MTNPDNDIAYPNYPLTLEDEVGGGYNAGLVVCPSGFSKKAFEFSKGKKITLIGLSRIMEMVNNNSVSFLK